MCNKFISTGTRGGFTAAALGVNEKSLIMSTERKEKIIALLKAIETGDEASVAVVNPNKYIQHNPQTEEGGEGLAELFKRLSKTSPRVNIVRIFSDGDYVFGHTEYEFSSSRVGFEGDQTVEHWDTRETVSPRSEWKNENGKF